MRPPPGAKNDRFPWRFIVYLLVLFYLVGDLVLFDGPIHQYYFKRQAFSEEARKFAEENKVIVLVNREPITKDQVALAVTDHLYRRGKTAEDLTEKNLQITTLAVVQDLVNDLLVTQYCEGEGFEVPEEIVNEFISSFESQFDSAESLAGRSEALKLDEENRNRRLKRLITEKYWIEKRIDPAVAVTDEEARDFYERNRKIEPGFQNPERFHARHIFLSTVMKRGPEREQLIRDVHRKLVASEAPFEKLAAEFSEDERTKNRGGDLNWFTAARMPDDFIKGIAELKVGEVSEPFQTSIGWHVVELLGRKPAEELNFDTLKPEIVAYLTSKRREDVLRELLEKLRSVASIEFFPRNL
ncbi:MAG: hypothetical protein HKN23_14955 [Verrucomicrobiales bacterium]|nr:hypothetical protein [Verrucomicrobiales bacterium]